MSRVLSITLLLVMLSGGCSLAPEIDGAWRTSEGVTVVWPELGFEGRLELVVGQYGEDVAGMLRFYEKDQEFKDNYLFEPCPCLYLDSASFDDSTLVFDVTPCGEDAAEWSGRFEWSEAESGEVLIGGLEPKDPDGGVSPTADFELRFSGGKKLIKENELNQECPISTQ